MSMMDYVIAAWIGLQRKLFQGLRARSRLGYRRITSAFAMTTVNRSQRLKAATDRSWHGGSFRGGYGNGLAADVVSVAGGTPAQRWISTENLWKWIDAMGTSLERQTVSHRDPPHVGPIDARNMSLAAGRKLFQAESDVKSATGKLIQQGRCRSRAGESCSSGTDVKKRNRPS